MPTIQSNPEWVLPQIIKYISNSSFNLPLSILAILERRGLCCKEDINQFLNPSRPPEAISHFPDLQKAIKRLTSACLNKEKIAVCGDYDADGITSTVLLIDTLNKLNAKTSILIPDRIKEGYGLNIRMVEELNKQDVKVIITVDNGIAAFNALNRASKYSIDVIVSDHHKIPDKTGDIFALIHTDTTPKDSPYRVLAGVGLAYIIALELSKQMHNSNSIINALDYFCIGTIADMTPLVEANRYFLLKGIGNINKTNSKGLLSIQKSSGIKSRVITSQDISYKIAPRINSIGRISNPNIIINLMLENDDNVISELSKECENINLTRKNLCTEIENQALLIVEENQLQKNPFILVTNDRWHSGVIGIVAARLVERYTRAAAVLTKDCNGYYRASARAPKGFNLIKALDKCKELFESYGGHAGAAGFTIKNSNLESLEEQLINISHEYPKDIYTKKIHPEVHINFNEIDNTLITSLDKLEPFGVGNPKPIFWTRKCEIVEESLLKNKYQKLLLKQNGQLLQAIDWNPVSAYRRGERRDIAYNIGINEWKNKVNIQLDILASREYCTYCYFQINKRIYECYLINENCFEIKNEEGKTISSTLDIVEFSKGNLDKQNYIHNLFSIAKLSLGIIP